MQKTAYEVGISDWGSDVCSSDLCVADHAPAALRHGDAADLGRAALARHFDAFDLHTRPPGGASAVDHRVHSVPHQLDMGGVDGERLFPLPFASQEEGGRKRPAGRHTAAPHCKLKGVRKHIALADGGGTRLPLKPWLAVFLLLTRLVGHGAI